MQKSPLTKDDWGYEDHNGPHKWHEPFPVARAKRQSPIDILTNKAKYDGKLVKNPLTMNYESESGLEIANTGHSIQAAITKHSVLEGGPLTDKYALAQFHLHWGSEKGRGSEHTIDGKNYEAELHLVHYNEKYGSFGNAVDKSDGLAVVGIMLLEGDKQYDGLSPISDGARNVPKSKDKYKLSNNFHPANLLPGNTKDYWTYLGSLTTPPLFESVTWIVLKDPIVMSKKQLENLRSMQDCHDLKMVNNYRPPCPIEGREVSKSF
uniref:Carbonic anhydrase n=1 Tax=Tridacna squamosa TaxID=80830 RepID=A0A3G1J6U0_TRISQ|nr:carbonic anhydrase 2 [Tridacna squamosa]